MNASNTFPIPETNAALVPQLIKGLDETGLQWLSGYFAGSAALLHDKAVGSDLPALDSAGSTRATILYGSQTGNCARVAEQLQQGLQTDGKPVQLQRTDSYPVRELKNETLLFVVISTQGDGEPPDDARAFCDFLFSRRAPQLDSLKFAVLGLGDSSYPEFCIIGKRIDERLAELGAERIQPLATADVDIESVAAPWLREQRQHAEKLLDAASPARATVTALHPRTPLWTRDKPFAAEVLLNQPIMAGDNGRSVRHLELSIDGSGLSYEPGDALGIWPRQRPELVQSVLDSLKLDGDALVEYKDEALPLRQWLGEKRELTVLSRPFLLAHAERGGHDDLEEMLNAGSNDALSQFIADRQLPDLLRSHRTDWDAQDLVTALRPLTPRLYSIASSQKRVDEEVHLTVAELQFQHQAQERWGVASRFLATRREGDTVPVFIEPNTRFRLPESSRDAIMIGPGTGVAPFRAFMQERQEIGASGRNWLLFGNRHRRTEFLYQLEWQDALRQGDLDRIDVAFSRDQTERIHVQHRLRQNGKAIFDWLERGAHLYVCGDATRMARDVHAALIDILAEHGAQAQDDAAARLNAWLAEGRYVRDVY